MDEVTAALRPEAEPAARPRSLEHTLAAHIAELRSLLRRREAVAALVTAGVAAALAGWLISPSAAAVLLVGLAGIAIAWRDSRGIPYFVALLLPAGIYAPEVLGVRAPVLEVAVGSAGAGYVLSLIRSRRRPELGAADYAFLAFLVAVAVSGFGPGETAVWLHRLVFWSGLALVFHAASRSLSTEKAMRALVAVLTAVALLEAVWALVEYVDRRSLRQLRVDGVVVWPRPEATLGHENTLAFFLVFCLLMLTSWATAQQGARRIGLLALGGVLGLAIAATFSRAAWIALVIGFLVIGLERRARLPLLAVGTGAAVLALAFAGSDREILRNRLSTLLSPGSLDPDGFHVEMWRRAAAITVDHPITGAGSFREVALYAGVPHFASHPHNLVLGLAVFFGLLAAIAFTALLALSIAAVWRGWRWSEGPAGRHASLGVFAVLVTFAFWGVIGYPLWDAAIAAVIVLVTAQAVALGRAAAPPRVRGPGPLRR